MPGTVGFLFCLRRGMGGVVLFAKIVGVCGFIGLFLAAAGMFGVVARTVAQRTSEIGIRIALGAKRGDVPRVIAGSGARMPLIDAVGGLVGVFVLNPVLIAANPAASLSAPITDWRTLLTLAIALFAMALLASYLPSRRATKVDPIQALRVE